MNDSNESNQIKAKHRSSGSELSGLVMRLTIAGIDLEIIDEPPWNLRRKNWVCYLFVVAGPADVSRSDLNKMIGKQLYGKPIVGIESFAVEGQIGKQISIAINA